MNSIAVIGAGISGLACAARLKDAGLAPVVLDKGRNIGGRLATRITRTGLQFDHSAQYIKANTDGFADVLRNAQEAGAVGPWQIQHGTRLVGTPGMRSLATYIGDGLDVRQNTKVSALRETAAGYDVTIDGAVETFDGVVSTVPAPQAIDLLEDGHPCIKELARVEFHPCLTLMVMVPADQAPPFTTLREPDQPLSWIALDSSKPGRTSRNCWVAQASPDWSRAHLELDADAMVEQMLDLFCARTGFDPATPVYASAHRWRYAAVSKPLGRPFLNANSKPLYFGGDWCLEARVEAAWLSGTAIAEDILQVHG